MIAMKQKFLTEVPKNQIRVSVGGSTFYLYTDDNEEKVEQDVQEFLGGISKLEKEPKVIAVLDTPIAAPKKRGRPRKTVAA